MHCLEEHSMLSSLSLVVKRKQYFVSSSDIFLVKKILLKIWLNPGFNLTIFQGTGPTGCKESHFYSLPFGQAEASIY